MSEGAGTSPVGGRPVSAVLERLGLNGNCPSNKEMLPACHWRDSVALEWGIL